MLRTKKNTRKYYLHQKIKSTHRYSASLHTCYINTNNNDDIPLWKYLAELRDNYGYSLQLTID